MRKQTTAILGQLGRRFRWGLAAGFAYFAFAAVTIHSLPTMLKGFPAAGEYTPTIAYYVSAPAVLMLLHLVSMFSFAATDNLESGYEPHLFRLPVATRTLATLPMLLGFPALAVTWFITAVFVLRPGGINVPLWWPCFGLGVVLAAVHAMSWLPLKQPWLRVFIAVPALIMLAGLAVLFVLFEVREAVITAICLVLLVPLQLVASAAVRMSRRGDSFDLWYWHILRERIAMLRKAAERPFPTPRAAQIWFEWRGFGWILPAMVVAFLICTTPIMLMNRTDVGFSWRLVPVLLFLPAITAFMMGSSTGRQDSGSSFEASTFVFARPQTSGSIVRAKFLVAGMSALVATLPAFVILPLLLLRPGFPKSVAEAAAGLSPGSLVAVISAGFIAPFLATWLGIVLNMWIGLTGRNWIAQGFPVAMVALTGCSGAVGFWIYLHPAWHPAIFAALPWIMVGLAILKLLAVAMVMVLLERRTLVTVLTALGASLGWLLLVLALSATAARWIPNSEIWVTISLAILIVPVVRLAAATLALDWNRHR